MEEHDPLSYAHMAVFFILGCIFVGIAWDVVVVIIMGKGPSLCQACRWLNKRSDGLFALTWIALTIHIFAKWYLPIHWLSK